MTKGIQATRKILKKLGVPTIHFRLHSKSAPIHAGEPILLSWITPYGLIKKPKGKKK